MPESTDFLLLGSATTTPPHCTFEIAVFYGKSQFQDESTVFFVLNLATTPPPRLAVVRVRQVNLFGYYPKSQDFSEFRLGNTDISNTIYS